MNNFRVLIYVFAVFTCFNGHAADEQGKFAMKGAGLASCNVFTQERALGSQAYYLIGGWVEGYVSAHNKLLPKTFDITPFESLELLLKIVNLHCEAHPEDLLHGVVDGMIAKLASQKLIQDGPKIKIEDGERNVYLYRDTINEMQQKLSDLKLYKGPVDGVFSDATQAALIAYQSDIRFAATGFPDQATLWRLLRQ